MKGWHKVIRFVFVCCLMLSVLLSVDVNALAEPGIDTNTKSAIQKTDQYVNKQGEVEEYHEIMMDGRIAYVINLPETMGQTQPKTSAKATSNEQIIWNYFKSKGFSDAGVAGIMGNLQAESGYEPTNLENRANTQGGMTDAQFTTAVNNGSISRAEFISSQKFGLYSYSDSTGSYRTYGYGLAQWTFYSRKANLYDFWKRSGKSSIGDLNMQLDFMMNEMSASLKSTLTSATDYSSACLTFHNVYEGSADTASQIQGRINNAKSVYNKYATTTTTNPAPGGEYAWFPMDTMSISQIAYESYSHGNLNAIDACGSKYVFAPFTGKVVGVGVDYTWTVFQSVDKVHFADGSYDYMTLYLLHGKNYQQLLNYKNNGTIIPQGTNFYEVGQTGVGGVPDPRYGIHAEIRVHKGKTNTYFTGDVYAFNAFFINRAITKTIIKEGEMEPQNHMNNGAPSNWSGKWKNLSASPSTYSITAWMAKSSISVQEKCSVGGFVSAPVKISSVTAGVYRNAQGTDGPVNGVEQTRNPNSTSYDVANMDRDLHFEDIREGGTLYYVVKATFSNGKQIAPASKQFTVKGNLCSVPSIQPPSDIAGGKHVKITAGSSDTIHYTIKRDGTVVDTGTCVGTFNKDYTTAGKYNVSAWASRSGYSNSGSSSKDFTIATVAAPKIIQTATGTNMVVNMTSDTSGAAIYYTTSGNTPSTSSTKFAGALALTEEKTIKAIAVKSGMANSAVTEMTVKMEEPATPDGLTLTSESIIPEGETASVKWNASNLAAGYIATLYKNGTKVGTTTVSGTTATFILPAAGDYTINVYATNFVGNSTEAEQAVSVKAMAPSTVTFKDWDGSVIKAQEVPYGKDATLPNDPSRRGYTFLSWTNGDQITNVKEDLEVTANYKINTYTVRFYNAKGTQVGPAQKVQYLNSATSPEADLDDIPTGYVFAGWKVISSSDDSAGDYTAVDSDLKLQAIYLWGDKELPIVAEIISARQNLTSKNYNVVVKLTNYPDDLTTALLRICLYTDQGQMVKTSKTEVEVSPDGTTSKAVTLKYSGTATKATVVVLGIDGDDRTGSAYSRVAEAPITVKSDEVWTDWLETEPNDPDGGEIETMTLYRYSDKVTTESSSSTMSGWEQYDRKTVAGNWGAWSGWSGTAQTASDTKQVETRKEWRYYAFVCPVCGGREPFQGQSDCGRYSLSASNWDCAWFPTAYKDSRSTTYSYTTAKRHTTSLGDGKNWNFSTANLNDTAVGTRDAGGGGGNDVVIRQAYRYRTRTMNTVYCYYKWNDWSDWSETVYTATDTRKVETKTLYRQKVSIYSPLAPAEQPEGSVYHIAGDLASIDADLNGKVATIMVYKDKNTDPNEDQIQYVGQTTLGEGNTYAFDVIPKVDPTPSTGDFTVCLGVQGSTGLINIDMIRYQRTIYTVEFVDYDGSVISTQQVEEGANAVVPESPVQVGSIFTGWSETATNVQSNMTVAAQYVPIDYVVTFVDSANDITSFETYHYGDTLTPPEAPTATGKTFVGWDRVIAGNDTVTENMIVNAVYETEKYTVEFVDDQNTVVNTQQVEYGSAAVPPAALDIADREFLGWSTETEWWYVTEDMTVTPILAYLETASAPSYHTVVSENSVMLYLESATEDAEIYYTLETAGEEEPRLYDDGAVILEDFDIEEELDEENRIMTLHRSAIVNVYASKIGMNDSEVQKIVYTDTLTIRTDVTEATVTFEVNGGDVLAESTRTLEIGAEYGELPVPTYTGYIFEGWYTGAEDGAVIEAEDICTKDITLYAHWERNEEVHIHTIVIDEAVEATCQQEGLTEGRHCSECNEVLVAQIVIPRTPHAWNAGVVTQEATCTEDGERVYTCEVCGETRTAAIPATGHTEEEAEEIAATCTEAGRTAGVYCAVCGETLMGMEEIPALGHTWGEWTVVTPATCKTGGVEERICSVCGATETRTTEPTDHVPEVRNQAEATCAGDGYTGDTYCTVCGEVLQIGERIPATDHVWDEGVVISEATCIHKGIIKYTCTTCGEKNYEELPMGAHTGGKANCCQRAICSVCGEEYGELVPNRHIGKTEVRGHVDATSTEEGYTGDTYCTSCDQLIQIGEVIPVIPPENESGIRVATVSAKAGAEVVVPVSILQNTGIAGFSFDIEYDADILTLKSVTAGSLLTVGQVSTNGNVVNWYVTDNVNGDGEILKLTFEISEDAPEGDTVVKVSPHDGKKNLVDENGSFVDVNYRSGKVEVQRGILGDVNADNDITIADVVVLNRCVLGKTTIDAAVRPYADINDDGDLTIGDVVILNRHVLGKQDIQAARAYLADVALDLGAAGFAAISVDDVTVKPGTTIGVPVRITNNTGIAGFALKITVPKGFTLNSITKGSMLSGGTFRAEGNICSWYSEDYVDTDGVLLTLNLTASDDAYSGKVKIEAKDRDMSNITDEHGLAMAVEFAPGTITMDTVVSLGCESGEHVEGDVLVENRVEASCEEQGSYDEVIYCTECREELSRETIHTPALGHNWNDGKVTTEATCTEEGEKTFTCTRCHETRTETIPALGHSYEDVITAPTCTEQGFTTHTCSVCGDVVVDTYVDALGHDWDEGTVITPVTDEADGEIKYVCKRCGEERTEILSLHYDLTAENTTIKLSGTLYKYTGAERKPTPTVTFTASADAVEKTLVKDTDYTVSYKDNVNVGTATVTITGMGRYTGEIEATYSIKAPLTSVKLPSASLTYTGAALKMTKADIVVKANYNGEEKTLTTDDFTVSYTNNTKVGTATVTIKGKGDYTGTIKETFKITPKKVTPTVTLSKTSYTWDGKVKKPTVTVKVGSKTLTTASYTATFASGRKNVGKYTVKITLKGNYTGTKTVSFKINPKGTTLGTLTAGSKKVTVKWKKQATKMSSSTITGYEIQLATNSKFTTGKKTVTVSGSASVSKAISSLKGAQKYYVRIRTYKTVSGVKYYSPWSASKSVTTKK